jgi:hypothetical protein
LVGRERQWRTLEDAWEQRRIAVLTADAGMGKTRLLGDFARSRDVPLVGARPGDERVRTHCWRGCCARRSGRGGAATLDGQLRRELARVLPELGAAPSELMNEARFRQAVVQSLAARHTAGLTGLTLDDLHFADSASLELLPALLTSGLRFALAVRGAEMPMALDAWRRAETGEALIEVALPPLTEADVRQLLDTLALEGVDAAALAGPLARHTGGNPYFVLETLGAIVTQPDARGAALPTAPSVGALIERRLAQLSPAALRLARVAALAGADFSAALAAHVLQSHPLDLTEAWTELERAHVLAGSGFAHDLVRDVAARAVPRRSATASPWHRRIPRDAGSATGPRRAALRRCRSVATGRDVQSARGRRCATGVATNRRSRAAQFRDQRLRSRRRCRGGFRRALRERRKPDPGARSRAGPDGHRGHAGDRTYGRAAGGCADGTRQRIADGSRSRHGRGQRAQALALADGLRQPWLRFDAGRLLAIGLSQQGRTDEAEAVLTPFEPMVEAEGTLEQRDHYWSDLAYVLNSARRLRRTAHTLSRAIDARANSAISRNSRC